MLAEFVLSLIYDLMMHAIGICARWDRIISLASAPTIYDMGLYKVKTQFWLIINEYVRPKYGSTMLITTMLRSVSHMRRDSSPAWSTET